MGKCVCMGAQIQCSFGTSPGNLTVLPTGRVNTAKMPGATVMDNIPMMNILPFGQCSSPSNPMVAAATAAALGVLTPQPCIPATVAPWSPGSPTVKIGNMAALDEGDTLMCLWAGQITINDPGQQDVSQDN
ncbi:MAG: DUF4280 domain-containing protein [Crocinitomicaceae bacterium]|nr:DUF4280 domain-containing protein [Crocinitomicaceae bacterium]